MNSKPLRFLNIASAILLAVSSAMAQTPTAAPSASPEKPMAHAKAVPSTSLAIRVSGKTKSLTVADLQAMPQKTVSVHNAHSNADQTYTGVLLTDVLAQAGAADAAKGKPLLHSYVRAEGTDKYWVLYSGIEIEAASHLGDVIVATTMDGKPLDDAGAFMLVGTEDKKPQRWVHNLSSLTLVQVP